jgi:hypothetical protein
MIYLLGRSADARRSRADTIVFLTGESIVLGITYAVYGMYTRWDVELAALLMPAYGLCMWFGARRFSHTSEASYRTAILALLWMISALLLVKSAFALSL